MKRILPTQLGDSNLFSALTSGDVAGAIGSVYKTIDVHTSLTPPIVIDVGSLNQPSSPSIFTKLLKPTIILRGSAGGDVVLASPYGDPGDGTLGLVGIVLGLVGVGFALGRLSKRR